MVEKYIPTQFNFIHQAYSEPSWLIYGDFTINSESGVNQGDPWGLALYSIVVHEVITTLKCELNLWYLDDGTMSGHYIDVISDLNQLKIKICF